MTLTLECEVPVSQSNCSKPIKGNGSLYARRDINRSSVENVASQIVTVHTLSKFRVDVSCLSKIYLLPSDPVQLLNLALSRATGYIIVVFEIM